MSLGTILNIMAFNTEWERFYEIHGDNLDHEDVQDMANDLTTIWTPADINKVNGCDSVEEAFYFVDMEAQTMEGEALREFPHLEGVTKEVFKILVYGDYSNQMGWYDDWETLEARIFNYLPNNEQKNWENIFQIESLIKTDEANFKKIMGIISQRLLNLLWFDLIGVEIPVVEKFRLVEAYREEYEPNLSPEECYGSKWFFFENLLSCRTYCELLQEIADRENHFNLIEFDENGEEIEGQTTEQDYIHLLSPWISKACAWGGY